MAAKIKRAVGQSLTAKRWITFLPGVFSPFHAFLRTVISPFGGII